MLPDEMLGGSLKCFVNTSYTQLDCVGFFFHSGESFFVLPRVFLKKDENCYKAFGETIDAEGRDVFAIQDGFSENGFRERNQLLFDYLSEWLFSAMSYYHREKKSDCVQRTESPNAKKFSANKNPTLIDLVNSMRHFYRENEDLFVFIAQNRTFGNGKINWRKTITSRRPIIQQGRPIYVDPIVKSRVIDFDERLIVLYFSAMMFIQKTFGFHMPQSEYYDPLKKRDMEKLMFGNGLRELQSIKYKYFSDRFLRLYNILYGFFLWGSIFAINGFGKEYLLTNKFNNVFEDMIDTLIGDNLPENLRRLKSHRDGRRVDHIYQDKNLLFAEKEKIWYIGDSKYYKEDNVIRIPSLSKQYDYAHNIIQYNVHDSFSKDDLNIYRFGNSSKKGEETCRSYYRDKLTEGYSITPNFFIRGMVPEGNLSIDDFDDDERFPTSGDIDEKYITIKTEDEAVLPDQLKNKDSKGLSLWDMRNSHFPNRLFDRDTLLLQIYNLNFLQVLKLYATNDVVARKKFKEKMHKAFRKNFMDLLNKKYDFWALYPEMNKNPENIESQSLKNKLEWFVSKHFRLLRGKIFRRSDRDDFLILALESNEECLPIEETRKSIWPQISADCFCEKIKVEDVFSSKPLRESALFFNCDADEMENVGGLLLDDSLYLELFPIEHRLPKYAVLHKNGKFQKMYYLNGAVLGWNEDVNWLPFKGNAIDDCTLKDKIERTLCEIHGDILKICTL